MAEVTTQLLGKQIDKVLALTGEQSFLNWNDFEASSKRVMEAVNELNKEINTFREAQQIYFISNMKKMKGADLPDMFKSVKSGKLNAKALKPVTSRFKLNGDQIQLADSIENLKKQAQDSLGSYVKNNDELVDSFQKLSTFLKQRITKYDFVPGTLEAPKVESLGKYELKNKFEDSDLQNIANNITVQYIPGTDSLITLKTYSQIVQNSVKLATNQYIDLTKEARIKQRNALEKPKEYLDIISEFLTTSENLITDSQLSISIKLGITPQKFEETETLLMERGLMQNIMAIQTMGRAQIKQKLKAARSVTYEQSIEIISYQIELLEKKVDYIKSILSHFAMTPESVQAVPMILTYILNDLVYQKYEIEEEDFMQNINEDAMKNPELLVLFQKMQFAILQLMQKLGIVPEGLGQPGAPGAPGILPQGGSKAPPAGSLPPIGLMPGADPFAYQQMQAQLQMLNNKK